MMWRSNLCGVDRCVYTVEDVVTPEEQPWRFDARETSRPSPSSSRHARRRSSAPRTCVVGDHQLAQDLLQEALVKAYVAWPRLRDATKAEAYVRRTDRDDGHLVAAAPFLP